MSKTYEMTIIADTNDGDYVTEISEITMKAIERFKPLIKAIKKSKERHNFEWGECCDDYPEQYSKRFGEELLEEFTNYVPHGEYGIHTIESIYITPYVEKEYLL